MEKIEKLKMYVPEIEKSHYVAILNIANKVDEIIEVLNSQSQPEEKELHHHFDKSFYCVRCGVGISEYWKPCEKGKRKRLEDLTDEELKNVGITKTEDTPEEWFTMEELAYLGEVMHLDYSLAVTFGQREKSDIGGGLLRKLDKLNSKKK